MKVILMAPGIRTLWFHLNWIACLLVRFLLFFHLLLALLFPIYALFLLLLFLLVGQVFRSRVRITPRNLVCILLLIALSLRMNRHHLPSLLILCQNLLHFIHLSLLCLWIIRLLFFLRFFNSFFLNLLLHNL